MDVALCTFQHDALPPSQQMQNKNDDPPTVPPSLVSTDLDLFKPPQLRRRAAGEGFLRHLGIIRRPRCCRAQEYHPWPRRQGKKGPKGAGW
ncbi:hypothetical protein F1880_002158 [Penicillium rolfsii]|nr:hypothetical protein F1880_002158 [Penicillium rolfsii]